jgi:hypothetical protein
MKTRFFLALIASATLILTSCTMGPTTPVCYALVADITTPAIQAVTSPDGSIGIKRGEASVYNICFISSFGDSSIPAAAHNGNISDVKTVAYTYNNVFYIFQKGTTVVTGD